MRTSHKQLVAHRELYVRGKLSGRKNIGREMQVYLTLDAMNPYNIYCMVHLLN